MSFTKHKWVSVKLRCIHISISSTLVDKEEGVVYLEFVPKIEMSHKTKQRKIRRLWKRYLDLCPNISGQNRHLDSQFLLRWSTPLSKAMQLLAHHLGIAEFAGTEPPNLGEVGHPAAHAQLHSLLPAYLNKIIWNYK